MIRFVHVVKSLQQIQLTSIILYRYNKKKTIFPCDENSEKIYSLNNFPKNHTAVVFEAGQSGASALYGHVAFVEKVNDDGSIIISESNVKGLGIVSYRQIDADTASSLHYIQPK